MKRSLDEYFLGILTHHEEDLQDQALKRRKELRYYASQREETGIYQVSWTYWSNDKTSMYIDTRQLPNLEKGAFLLDVFEWNGRLPLHPRDSLKVLERTREAIHSWSLCALRMGVSRDVRIFIGKLIFELREEWK